MRAELVDRPIDVPALIAEVAAAGNGATSLFLGTVREVNEGRAVTGIDYSAYRSMALKELTAIVASACEEFGTSHVVVEHRLGTLAVGDVSVAIAVAHPRRSPALEATRYVIEQLKQRVPIWKREHYTDGTREWVDPTGAHAAGALSTAPGT